MDAELERAEQTVVTYKEMLAQCEEGSNRYRNIQNSIANNEEIIALIKKAGEADPLKVRTAKAHRLAAERNAKRGPCTVPNCQKKTCKVHNNIRSAEALEADIPRRPRIYTSCPDIDAPDFGRSGVAAVQTARRDRKAKEEAFKANLLRKENVPSE